MWLPTSMPNSNFLTFSESFYIAHYKNKGYRYYLGKEDKQSPQIKTRESKTDRLNRYFKMINKKI